MTIQALPGLERRYQQIAQRLAAQIDDGTFREGDRLPAERDLSREMDVSRTTLREALIALELMNYVEIRTGSGIYVLPVSARRAAGAPVATNEPGPLEVLELRRVIEGTLAAAAAAHASDAALADIVATVAAMRKAIDDVPEFDRLDRRFHLQIAEASGNSLGPGLVDWMWGFRGGAMWRKRYGQTRARGNREISVEDHARIVRALTRRMPDRADTAMRAHVDVLIGRFLDLGFTE